MKKLVLGCLIVLVIAMIGFGAVGYYAYRWARPMIESTGAYLDHARELARLGDRIQNRAPYVPPANSELTTSQVDRFLAVQTRVREELGTRWAEIETKSAELREKTQDRRELTFAEFTSVFSDLANIYTEGRQAQVTALNTHKFSDGEYAWVRRRVYEAAGMEIASGLDLSRFEELARDTSQRANMKLPDLPRADVPPANIKLVKPHLTKLKESLPIAILGL